MNFTNLKEKIKSIDWKGVFLSRNFIIVCCVMLVAAGIIVFSAAGGAKTDGISESGTRVLGNAVLVGSEVSAEDAEAEAEAFLRWRSSTVSARATRPWKRSGRSPIRPNLCPTPKRTRSRRSPPWWRK